MNISGGDRLSTLSGEEQAALWADRFLSGALSASERADFQAWLEADPQHEVLWQAHRRFLTSDPLQQALRQSEKQHATPRRVQTGRRRSRQVISALRHPVILGLMAAGVCAVGLNLQYGLLDHMIGASLRTARGEMRQEALADGSQLHLNGDSSARIHLRKKVRDIRLEHGEAYFQVAHDRARPFVVHAPEATVTAVGTAFNVNQLNGATEVAVYEGKVRVDPVSGASFYLVAGQRARISPRDRPQPVAFVAEAVPDWRTHWVEVENGSLGDLLTELSRSTQLRLKAEGDGLTQLKITGRFRTDQPEVTLNQLAATHDLTVVKTAQGFELRRPAT